MKIYLLEVQPDNISLNDHSRLEAYPLMKPDPKKTIVVETHTQFPDIFQWQYFGGLSITFDPKIYTFRTLKKLFDFVTEKQIDLGVKLGTFYHYIKKMIPEEIPEEGSLIYQYNNIKVIVHTI